MESKQTNLFDLFLIKIKKDRSKQPWYRLDSNKSWRLKCPGNPNLWDLYHNGNNFPFSKEEKWYFSRSKLSWISNKYYKGIYGRLPG